MTPDNTFSRGHTGLGLALISALALNACSGNGSSGNNEFAALANATSEGRARALAVTVGAVVNRYDFATSTLSLPILPVVDGSNTTCYTVGLRNVSAEPFVLEVSSATAVTCASVGTAPGNYVVSTGKLTLPGMSVVNGTASSCYDVVMNRTMSDPIRLQLVSATVASCAGVSSSTTSTAGVECSYSYSALNSSASVNLTSTSNWTCNSTSRVLAANGVPDHATGAFPNPGNPNTMTAQTVAATYTLSPTFNGTATTLGGPRGATGYVLNGVKVDAGTAGTCPASATATSGCSLINNTGAWSIEALGQTTFNFGADTNNAHVQPGGSYHYHGMPEGFITLRGGGPTKMTLVGWAADGFPIYARYGYSVATNASSALKVVTGSYKLKTTVSATRPSSTLMPLGTFAQDWEYVAGTGDLDECNGRTGVTPEFPNGIYHYYATDSYPYFQRCIKGNP